MPAIRILARLFLVLALLAGGVAPGLAAAGESDEGTMSAPCHDLAGDAIEPAPADCCADGGCTCDCVHHAPAGVVATPRLPRLALRGINQQPVAAVLPLASAAPEIRPPIG